MRFRRRHDHSETRPPRGAGDRRRRQRVVWWRVWPDLPDPARRSAASSWPTPVALPGMAFDAPGPVRLDLAHAAGVQLDGETRAWPLSAPAYASTGYGPDYQPSTPTDGYVSDSWRMREPGPGILRFSPIFRSALARRPFDFADGSRSAPVGSGFTSLRVRRARTTIEPDRRLGGKRSVLAELPDDTNGLAVPADGSIIVGATDRVASCASTPAVFVSVWPRMSAPTCSPIRPTSPSAPTD